MFSFLKRKKYKLSQYNTVVKHSDGWLLHNQFSGSLILMNDAIYQVYQNMEKGRFSNNSKILEQFREQGFVIDASHDELAHLSEAWELAINSSSNKSLTITTTDRCNLGCTYCYEKKEHWVNMSKETQEDLKIFAKTLIESTPTTSFGVTWFGGEPTLNMQCIENLSTYFKELCDEKGIPFSQYAITNGTTLKPILIERLKALGIIGVQITVDGIQETHDKSRPYLMEIDPKDLNEWQIQQRIKIDPQFGLNVLNNERKKRSSYEDIIENLQNCRDMGINVSLRINMSVDTNDSADKLIEFVISKGWNVPEDGKGLISPYKYSIFDGCSSKANATKAEISKLIQNSLRDHFEAKDLGTMLTKKLKSNLGTCTANKNFEFVITPKGNLVKCWHHAVDDSHKIGTVRDLELARDGADSKNRYKFSPLVDKECRSCSVLPLCFGGCKILNKFDSDGYDGNHQQGCSETRWILPELIKDCYEVQKELAG